MSWKEERNLLDKAGQLAEDILRVLRMNVPPIEPISVLESESPRLRARGGNFRNLFDGQLEYHPSKQRFLLFYNTKYDGPDGRVHPRTRFSIAHELGHFYLDHHRARLVRGAKAHPSRAEFVTDVLVEREADSFAAHLLLPESIFSPLANRSVPSLSHAKFLRTTFNTSLTATLIRLVEVSHFPCAVVGLRDDKISWFRCSTPLVDVGIYPRLNRHRLPDAAEQACHSLLKEGVRQTLKSDGRVSDWFEVYDRHELGETWVLQEFVGVPSMGFVVVLLTIAEDDLMEVDE
jgi:hypothetical protein